MSVEDRMRRVLRDVLQLGSRAATLESRSPLLGSLPELDSMAVASVLTGIEDEFDITIEDDEISAEMFETLGTLCDFVAQKQMA